MIQEWICSVLIAGFRFRLPYGPSGGTLLSGLCLRVRHAGQPIAILIEISQSKGGAVAKVDACKATPHHAKIDGLAAALAFG